MLKTQKSLVNAGIFTENYQHSPTVLSVERKTGNFSSKYQQFYHGLITRSFPHFNRGLWKILGILDLLYKSVKVCFVVANSLNIDVYLLNGRDGGRVITGEYLTYVAERKLGELSDDIDTNMSRVSNVVGSLS